MARIPDLSSFKLSDVITIIDASAYFASGTVTSVTDGTAGAARFNCVIAHGMIVGEFVELSNFTYYTTGVPIEIIAVGTTWFELEYEYFYLDDTGAWDEYVDIDRLSRCFDFAWSTRFDPLYSGSKDRLSNFRNYGWSLSLSVADNEDDTNGYSRVHGEGDEIYVACENASNGIVSYTVSPSNGTIVLHGSGVDGTDGENYIWAEGGFVFTTNGPDHKVKSWTTSGGALTRVTSWDYTYQIGGEYYMESITGDGNKFIFVSANHATLAPRILTFEYNPSTAALTYKTAFVFSSGSDTIDTLYYKNGWLFFSGSDGIRSFSVNPTTGALGNGELGEGSAYHPQNIFVTDTHIIASTPSYGLMLFSYDDSTGYVTVEDNDTSPGASVYGYVTGDENFFYCQIYDSGYKVACWRLGAGDTLVYCTKTVDLGGYTGGWAVYSPTLMTNSVCVYCRYDSGITSLQLT